MPRFPYEPIGNKLGRDLRNAWNQNLKDIEADIKELNGSQLDALEAAERANESADNADEATSRTEQATQEANTAAKNANTAAENTNAAIQTAEQAASNADDKAQYATEQGDYAKRVAEDNQTRFLDAVSTVEERDTTYPNPEHGDTIRVTGEAQSYRYVAGEGWVMTDQYNPTAIDEVSSNLNSVRQDLAQTFDQSMFNKQILKSKYDGMVGGKNKYIIIRKLDNDNYDILAHYHQLKYIGYRFSRNDSFFDVPALANGRPFSYYSSQEIEVSNQKDSGLINDNLKYEGTWTDSVGRKYSESVGDYVEYRFYGSKVLFSTYMLNNGGIASVTIDGKAELCDAIPLINGQALVDTYSVNAVGKNFEVANNLDEGWHTIRVTVTGDKNPASTGARVYFTIFRTWQSIYAEQQSIDHMHIRGTGNIFKGPARIIEPVLQVGGAFVGSYHGYTQPKVANDYDLIADGEKVVMNSGEYIVCSEVQFNQNLEYAKPSGDIFGDGTLIYSINAERLGVLFNFDFTESTSTTRFFPVMAGVRADHYIDSENMRKYKLQRNGNEIEISHNPFDVLLTNDSTNNVYLMVINDVRNSMVINSPNKHFIADLASQDAKPYFNANENTFKNGDSFKIDVDHYIGHCYKPSNLI